MSSRVKSWALYGHGGDKMSTRLKRWARAIQEIDLSKRVDPEVAIGYLDSKYRDIAWRYIRILGFERTISFMASNNFHPE